MIGNSTSDSRDDENLMRRCLELGRAALERGDAPVGAIIVRGGETVAKAVEAVKQINDPTAHAELLAVRRACEKLGTLDLSDSVLYTNVEPCWMCAYAIRQTKIKRVVFGSRNEQVGGYSSRFQVLLDENLKLPIPGIDHGVLRRECDSLLAEFERKVKPR